VPDQKPPRLDGDELDTLRALLQYQRDSLVRKVVGVDEEAARRSPVDSGTTLLWLVQHMAHAEVLWIVRRFAAEPVDLPDAAARRSETLATAIDHYRDSWGTVDAVVTAAPSLEQACRETGGEATVNLRWVLMHLLEETARHAGHADILRELIDGHTGR
jgi:uncharacterized damage-inducible protein DinB